MALRLTVLYVLVGTWFNFDWSLTQNLKSEDPKELNYNDAPAK